MLFSILGTLFFISVVVIIFSAYLDSRDNFAEKKESTSSLFDVQKIAIWLLWACIPLLFVAAFTELQLFGMASNQFVSNLP